MEFQEMWYEGEERNVKVFAVINEIEDSQSGDGAFYDTCSKLYEKRILKDIFSSPKADINIQVNYNVIKSCIDSLSAKISKNKPSPMFITEGGDWIQREQSKNLTSFINTVFYDQKAYTKGQKLFKLASVFGTSAMKVFIKDNAVQLEPVNIQDIRVESTDGWYGKPESIHHVMYLTNAALRKMFPEKEVELLTSNTSEKVLKVVESWSINNKHSICTKDLVLLDEEYKEDYLPFVFFRMEDAINGFFGRGLTEELIPIQTEVNYILDAISQAHDKVVVPRVYIENGAKVSVEHVNNEIGSVVRYTGNAPIFNTATGFNSETYRHLQWLIESAYKISGVSEMSATGTKPVGVEAAVAMRTLNDIETERFVLIGQRYEELFIDITMLILKVSESYYQAGDKIKIMDNDKISFIKWSDVFSSVDSLVTKVYPTNLLPSTPAGKLQRVMELIDGGIIDKEAALKLLDFPDVQALMNDQMAERDIIEQTLAEMIKTGKYISVEPQSNLQIALNVSRIEYLKGVVNKLPDNKLELIQRYLSEVSLLINKTEAENAIQPVSSVMPESIPASPIQQ